MTDKPKRPPTSGTRKGNGPGYGGPAKGFVQNATPAAPSFGPGTNAQGHSKSTSASEGNRQALWREQAAELMATLHGVAIDPTRGATQVKAIETFQDRVWGRSTQRQEVQFKKVDPNKIRDSELAAMMKVGQEDDDE